MSGYKVEVTEKAFQNAVKRHEDKWQEELKNVDIRAVVLKTKKAVLEQAMRNAAMENHVISYTEHVTSLEKQIAGYEMQVDSLQSQVTSLEDTFKQAINLLAKEPQKPQGFFAWLRSLFR